MNINLQDAKCINCGKQSTELLGYKNVACRPFCEKCAAMAKRDIALIITLIKGKK